MTRKKRTFISFDWALKHLLREKANHDVLEGFVSVILGKTLSITQDYNVLKVMASSDSLYYDSYQIFCIFTIHTCHLGGIESAEIQTR